MEAGPKNACRRSTRLMEKQQRRQEDYQAGEPCGKRPCTSQAAMLRVGSLESSCTQIEPPQACAPVAATTSPVAALAARTHDAISPNSGSPATMLPSPGSQGSDQTPVDAEVLQQADGTPVGAAAGAAGMAAHSPAAAAAQSQPRHPDGQRSLQWRAEEMASLLPPAFLAELAEANERVQRLPLPGGLPFYAVHPSCMLLPLWCTYGVSPAAVVLGTSYFQRLLLAKDNLRAAADAAGYFSIVTASRGQAELVMHVRPGSETLLAAYCTCVYLGIKVADTVRFSNQLSHMITSALGARVDHRTAVGLEMQVLELLGWRLGPYCCKPRSMGPW